MVSKTSPDIEIRGSSFSFIPVSWKSIDGNTTMLPVLAGYSALAKFTSSHFLKYGSLWGMFKPTLCDSSSIKKRLPWSSACT